MSENTDTETESIFIKQEKPKLNKNGKPKKEMSAERRAMLLENLKRGRETSAKNRKKNAEAKKIIKKKKKDFIDETVREQVLKEEAEKQSYQSMKKELEELKSQMKATKIDKTPKKVTLEVPQSGPLPQKEVKSKPVSQPIDIPKTISHAEDEYMVGKRMSNDDIIKNYKKNAKPRKISTFKSMWKD